MSDKRILLAEDDPSHVAFFRRALAATGIECCLDVVRDGAEAIDYLFCTGEHAGRDARQSPDLILLDLKMPRMDGLQVLKVLHRVRGDEQLRLAPIVVLTSSDLESDVSDAYRWGAQGYIRKPLAYGEFAIAIRETIHYWLVRNRSIPRHHAVVASSIA